MTGHWSTVISAALPYKIRHPRQKPLNMMNILQLHISILPYQVRVYIYIVSSVTLIYCTPCKHNIEHYELLPLHAEECIRSHRAFGQASTNQCSDTQEIHLVTTTMTIQNGI